MAIVNKDMIVLARDSRGISQKELADRIRISQAALSKIENGLLQISVGDLCAVADATGYHPEFFYCTEPLYGLGSSALFNRRKKGVRVAVQRKIQAKVNIARIQLIRLLRAAEIEAFNRFKSIDVDSVDGDAAEVARRIRAAWRLPMGPVQSITSAIESAGGIVLLCDFATSDIDATHIWTSAHPPMFFMNANASGDRHRFNLAHELAHAIMHEFPVGDVEEQANAFASEFLAPADEIGPELSNLTIRKLAKLKQRWKISMAALIYTARRLGRISQSKCSQLYAALSRLGYRKIEPIDIPVEQPTLVPQLIELHKSGLGYSNDDMLALFMTDEPDFFDSEGRKFSRSIRLLDEPIQFEMHLKKQA